MDPWNKVLQMGSCWCAISVCQGFCSNICATLTARACVSHHAGVLSLQAVFTAAGLRLWPSAGASPRIQALAPAAFSPRAQNGHVLRTIARAVALDSIQNERLDAEGASDVDIAAQSHPQWKQWKKSLSTVEQTWLRIWRGGAVKTRTRRWWRPNSPLQMTQCRCGALRGSAKHLFEECPLLQQTRQDIAEDMDLPLDFFQSQPRITSKSGWITVGAHPAPATRVRMQIASCRMGFSIVALGAAVPDASPD